MLTKARHITLGFIDFFHKPFAKWIGVQNFRYLACGGSNAVLQIIVFYASYHFILHKQSVPVFGLLITPYMTAFVIAFLISFPLGFILSKYIVFPESNLKGSIQILRYGLLVAVCVLLNVLLIKIFVEWCHFYPTPSNILTNIIVALFSYISQRKFTFKVKPAIVPTGEVPEKLILSEHTPKI